MEQNASMPSNIHDSARTLNQTPHDRETYQLCEVTLTLHGTSGIDYRTILQSQLPGV